MLSRGEPVVIVDSAMARTLWPKSDPLDQCLILSMGRTPHVASMGSHSVGVVASSAAPADQCSRVVGVVASVKQWGVQGHAELHYYVPLGQAPQGMSMNPVLVVRASSDPAGRRASKGCSLASAIRSWG